MEIEKQKQVLSAEIYEERIKKLQQENEETHKKLS